MKKTLSNNIIKVLQAHRNEIKSLGVKRIGLFGSAVRGSKNIGDLDFLVTFNKPTFDNYMDLKFFLEGLFNKKIDLVTENSLKPALQYVKKEAVYAE